METIDIISLKTKKTFTKYPYIFIFNKISFKLMLDNNSLQLY